MMTFNDITAWTIIPIHRLVLCDPSTDQTVEFFNAEQDSTYTCDPVTRGTMYGGVRQIGWRFECTFIPVQTDIHLMIAELENYLNKDLQAYLELRALDGQANGGLLYADLGQRATVSWSYNKGEMRPRLSVVVTAFLASSNTLTEAQPW